MVQHNCLKRTKSVANKPEAACAYLASVFFRPGRQSTIDIQRFKLQSLTGEAEIVYDRTSCERGAV